MNKDVKSARQIEVLLVEDNEDDVVLTTEGFELSKMLINLNHAENGEECLTFLRKQGKYANAPTPDIILLDLNMPRMDGREVMQAISSDENLNHIPVIVLTSSDQDWEVLKMYKLGCKSYIVKPVNFKNFVEMIKQFTDYWLTVVVLPRKSPNLRIA